MFSENTSLACKSLAWLLFGEMRSPACTLPTHGKPVPPLKRQPGGASTKAGKLTGPTGAHSIPPYSSPGSGWPTMQVHIGLRDFPGWVTFRAKTRTVPGKPGWLITFPGSLPPEGHSRALCILSRAGIMHSFLFFPSIITDFGLPWWLHGKETTC